MRGPVRRSTASTQSPTSANISGMRAVACSPKAPRHVNRTPPQTEERDMASHKPALQARSVAALNRSVYPEPYRSRVLPREKRRLGDAFGLTRIGVNHTTLPPGKESSMRHWHSREDEFVYVLEGELMLRTGAGEQLLSAGMCAGFPAGVE